MNKKQSDNASVSREECEAILKLAEEATMMPQTQVQLWHFRNDSLRLARAHLTLLDSSEQTIAEHAPQFDIGERVVLVTFPDQRGAVTECDVFGSVTVRLDDGCTGHFPIRDLAAECCLQDLQGQLAQAQEFYAKIADFYAKHDNPLQARMAKAIAEAIRASVRSEPVANAQAPDGEANAGADENTPQF